MEYDPASPTDEPEDCPVSLDLSSIPLPESIPSMDPQFLDIPLPNATFDAPDIPLPPVVPAALPAKIDADADILPNVVEAVENDSVSGPLKFSIKIAKPLTGQDNSGDSSGVFESSKDVKNEETKLMPKLQAMMKRSKPCQLPVGVLPAKTKLPPTETKSELFLPSKDTDTNGNALLDNPPQLTLMTTNSMPSSVVGITEVNELHSNSNTFSMTAAPNDTISTFVSSVHSIQESNASLLSSLGLSSGSLGSLASSVLSNSSLVPSTHIPNLMSLTVQPVPISTLPAAVSAMPVDHTALLRQPKMNMANMQYVNPQKLRSAQMIATPLIANPALAGQHQSEEQSKKRENRRRSRSRSRSSSRRRDRYRDSSSSSASPSPRRSTYRYRRRSRSRRSRSSSGRYSRTYDSGRYSRDRRDSARRRETRRERSNSLNNSRDNRRDKNQVRKRSRSKESINKKEHKQSESKSHSRRRSDESKEVKDRKDSRTKEKGRQSQTSTSVSKSKEQNSKVLSSSRSNHRPNTPEKKQSSRIQDESKKVTSSKRSDKPHRQTLADLLEREQHSDRKRLPAKDPPTIPAVRSKSGSSETCGSPDRTTKSATAGGDKTASSHESDGSSNTVSESDSSSDVTHDPPSGEVTGNAKEHPSRGQNSSRNPPLKTTLGSENVVTRACPQECMDSTIAAGNDSMDLESGIEIPSESPSLAAAKQSANERIFVATQATETSQLNQDFVPPENLLSIQADSFPHDYCAHAAISVNLPVELNDEQELQSLKSEGPFPDEFASLSGTCTTEPLKDRDHEMTGELLECVNSESATKDDLITFSELNCKDQNACDNKYHLRKRAQKLTIDRCELASCLTDNCWGVVNQPTSPREAFAAFPDAPKPEYLHISTNDYSRIGLNHNLGSRASLLGSVNSTNLSHHDMRQWICDCTPPSSEQISMGFLSCGHGCINRALNIECGSQCPSGHHCGNRQFQQLAYAPAKPVYCSPEKGWGLAATAVIPKNTFVIEYVGEVIDFPEFKRRIRRYERIGRSHHYFMALESDSFIDSGSKGNWARFVNHSCEPNCVTQKWCVDGRIRIGFFSKTEIPAGEEITIDYQFVQFGATEQKCYCGTSSCSGIMGYTSKLLQDKVRQKDTSVVERRVTQLLQLDCFHSAEEITLLLQVMVQECLTRYTRLKLLERLAATDAETCLKLFRQYNGLDMIAAFMCDAEPTDWVLKKQILLCLERIPVSEQKQVQTPSRLMEIVSLWTTDPRYCRSRGGQQFSEVKNGDGKAVDRNCSHGDVPNGTGDASVLNPNVLLSSINETEDLTTFPSSAGPKTPTAVEDNVGQSVLETKSTTNGEFGGNTNSSMSSSITSSEHLSPTADPSTDCDLNAEVTVSTVVSESSTPYIDEESETVEALQCDENGFGDQALLGEIQQLAQALIERWSKLPWETYRIPRVERQETEKILYANQSSPLISWGAVLNDQRNGPTSWSQTSNHRISQELTNRSNRVSGKSTTSKMNSIAHQLKYKGAVLTKAERRRLFEAQVSATETDNSMRKDTNIAAPAISAARIRQLLTCSLLAELQPDSSQTLSSSLPSISDASDTERSDTCVMLKTLLHTLPSLVAKLPPERSLVMVTRLCEEMRQESEKTITYAVNGCPPPPPEGNCDSDTSVSTSSLLPAGWQSAIDSTGRTYFYNTQTKVVQWDRPVSHPPPQISAPESPVIDSLTRKRIEKQFAVQVTNHILRLLKPYQLPNCVTGRINSKDDVVHITKKLSRAFVSKEIKRSKHPPIFSTTLADRIRSSLTRYMVSRGPVYTRRHKTTNNTESQLNLDDLSSPSFS